MIKRTIHALLRVFGYQIHKIRHAPPDTIIQKPIDTTGVEVLYDAEFQKSCIDVRPYTLLDTSRLANLWQLCRMSNPAGNIVEVGSYRGGGALHLANSCPQRKIFACDSFQGFETLDKRLDTNFNKREFRDTSEGVVKELFSSRNKNATIIAGFFPNSCTGIDIGPISFVHLHVDIYKATIESLHYLATK